MTINPKGQVTIPKVLRDELGLRPGDRITFRILDNNTLVFVPHTVDLLSLKGTLKAKRRGVSVDDMNEAIRTRAAGR